MKSSSQLQSIALFTLMAGRVACADTTIIDSELADLYHFVDTNEVLINASPEEVWPHLVNLGSWMYEFSMIHESGPRHAEGEILRLYEGQDFFLQLTKLVPGKLMLGVSLPSLEQGEELTGIGMFSLTEVNGKTLVSSFLARQSAWTLDTRNTLRETRQSAEFQQNTSDRWNRFLTRLRELAEGTYESP
jgi:hypothetical protein